ncbi:MAG: cell division protein FtsA [Alphaproteobacteria bacterium]
MSFFSSSRNAPKKGQILAALDIGSSKIVCFIAKRDADDHLHVIGIGHQLSAGMKGGVIVDMDATERAIRGAMDAAEHMAGLRVERVSVNISGNHISSRTCQLTLPLHGREIGSADIDRVLGQSPDIAAEGENYPQEIIHTIPVSYSLDGQRGIRDPRGMVGHTLGAQLHVIAAGYGPVRTIGAVLARLDLEVEQMAVSAYASGLACLVEDEMDLGSVIIDMGAGTTTFAVFFDGQCVYTDGIPLGGQHVTNDIARGLTTTISHAERMKTLYGHALPSSTDDREIIDVPQVGEETPELANHVPKSHLINIIRPRLEEIFEMVRGKLSDSDFDSIAGRRVVLTGGASQMPGVREMAQQLLDKQVRLGRPVRIGRPLSASKGADAAPLNQGLAEATAGPGFATVSGLLAIAMQPSATVPNLAAEFGSGSWIERMQHWIKQNI